MLSFQGDLPYDHLICRLVDSILPESLHSRDIDSGPIGEKISVVTLKKLGIKFNDVCGTSFDIPRSKADEAPTEGSADSSPTQPA